MISKLQFLLLVDELLDIFHIFDEVKDDIFSEKDLNFFKAQLSSIKHVPADRSGGSKDHSDPFSCIGLEISHV